MTHRRRAAIVVALCAAAGAAAAASACSFPDHASTPHVGPELVLVARFEEQPTGVAVSRSGRVFVNFPRWRGEPETPVAEVLADGSTRPYPPDEKARGSLVSVQSVHVDAADRLWIQWPDSIAIGPDRTLYVACSQIHLMRLFNWGYSPRTEPYAVYRVALPR